MPSFNTLLALFACSALVSEPAASTACGQAAPMSTQCELTAFFNAHQGQPEASAPLRTLPAPVRLDGEPSRAPLPEAASWARGRTTTYVPAGFVPDHGKYDLLVHFHGVSTRMFPAFQAAGFEHAVLVTVNLGVGSGPYENRFAAPDAFPQLIDSLTSALDKHEATRGLKLGRIALSGWSAGYGAIKQVLAQPANRDRVGGVLLADGLHAGFMGPFSRVIDASRMKPFVKFAEQAAEGNKLMAVAHSSIRTLDYASTTETAGYLAASLGLQTEHAAGQRVGEMEMTSRSERRGFRVHGFAGEDVHAHVDHLAHIDETLLSQLRTWWNGEGSAPVAKAEGRPGS